MIKLDFQFDPDVSGPGGPYPDLWVDECQLGAFGGFQTFTVNNMDFSGPLPILGFARTLKVVANLLMNIRVGEKEYRDLSSTWTITFRATGNDVEISDHRGSASISLSEFQEAVQLYAKHVYEHCSKLSPGILDNEFVVAWWNDDDYFASTFEPKKTDTGKLTPKHPFHTDGG